MPFSLKLKCPVTIAAGFTGVFTMVQLACAQIWTLSSAPGNKLWRAISCSANGGSIVAASLEGIYRSTNSGATWKLTGTSNGQPWSSIASSAEGTKLVAGVDGGLIYVSKDGGETWQPGDAPSNHWQGVACSADGNRMIGVCGTDFSSGGIYTSTNAGDSWTISNPPTNGLGWYAVTSSADGTKLAAMMVDLLTPAGPYGWIYTSTNAGATWIQTTGMGWPCSLASSADGTKLVAATGQFGPLSGRMLTSANSGASWETVSNSTGAWSFVAASADGTHLIAAIGGDSNGPITGGIYRSTNSGGTWAAGDAPTNDWVSVASSADGGRLVAAINGGGIYICQTTLARKLDHALSGTNLLLAWTVPSTSLVLQGNAGLTTTNWTNVATPPSFNFTNLRDEVAVPFSPGSRFYRLKQE